MQPRSSAVNIPNGFNPTGPIRSCPFSNGMRPPSLMSSILPPPPPMMMYNSQPLIGSPQLQNNQYSFNLQQHNGDVESSNSPKPEETNSKKDIKVEPELKTSSKDKKTRECKHDSKDSKKESRRKKESKARTLGELVMLAAAEAKLKESKEPKVEKVEEPVAELKEETKENGSKPNETLYQDDIPVLTEEDFVEEIDLEGPIFNEVTTVKREPLSACPMKDSTTYYEESGIVYASKECRDKMKRFRSDVLDYIADEKKKQPSVPWVPSPSFHSTCKCDHQDDSSSDSEDENGKKNDNSQKENANKELLRKEVARKQTHPAALHRFICFNEKGLGNDGPICRCAPNSRSEGIRHYAFPGESIITKCDSFSNNEGKLFHYVLRVAPSVNPLDSFHSTIHHDSATYSFEGFSVFFHRRLPDTFPRMPVANLAEDIQFEFVEEPFIGNFVVGELELFAEYLLDGLLDLYDISRFPFIANQETENADGCHLYHIMPRYTKHRGPQKNLLPMSIVLNHLKQSFKPLINENSVNSNAPVLPNIRSQILCCPQKKPSAIRADGIPRSDPGAPPQIVHYSAKPAAYINSKSPELAKLTKKLNKMRHLSNMKGGATDEERKTMDEIQHHIDEHKRNDDTSRVSPVNLPADIFHSTGLMADITNHTFVLILAVHHVRYHWSLERLEERIDYKFKNRGLLELALTHPSFKNNYGTVADHAKNSMNNVGYKRKTNTIQNDQKNRKRGLKHLMRVMNNDHKESGKPTIPHNERLEFLGDAVVGLITSYRLFFLMKAHNEGGLATYRSCLVQNKNLANLSKNIGLRNWLMFFHGPELCHEKEFRHALANAFEAIMAAIYLDSDINVCDRVFSDAMYGHDPEWKATWDALPEHELKVDMPDGDRHLIEISTILQSLTELEDSMGVKFKHIRILAKSLTRKCQPFNDLTKGNNQRLEWLGDSILQLLVSDYLYRHFPHFHEGNLSLLRTCVVSNKTQSVICDDLQLGDYLVKFGRSKEPKLKIKDKADLVEALIGALLVDRGMEYCRQFIKVCFLPRLKHFNSGHRWNDAKSQLQQACLLLRSSNSSKPETPVYKCLTKYGDANSTEYLMAVYFRGKKLGECRAPNKLLAEMGAAKDALKNFQEMFPTYMSKVKNPIKDAEKSLSNHHGANAKRSRLDHSTPTRSASQRNLLPDGGSVPTPPPSGPPTPLMNLQPFYPSYAPYPTPYYPNYSRDSHSPSPYREYYAPSPRNYSPTPYNRSYAGPSNRNYYGQRSGRSSNH